MPEKDELDLLLDSALATYADPGPDSGLEQRVLAGLEAARKSGERSGGFAGRRRWLPWIIAVPAAAGLLILWLSNARIVRVPATQPPSALQANRSQPSSPGSSSTPQQERPSGAKARNAFRVGTARLKSCPDTKPMRAPGACAATQPAVSPESQIANAALPKLDVFPTPAPLSAEERTLVAVADAGPPPQREALIVSQKNLDTPLNIAALNIPPLAAPGEGKN